MSKSYYESDEFKVAATAKAIGTVLLATAVTGPVGGLATAAILYGAFKLTKDACDDAIKEAENRRK